MTAFTSSKGELNKAEIQGKSAAFTFSGSVDSKGRVTIPARIRDRLDLGKGDELSLSINSAEVVRKEVGSLREAVDFVRSFQNVRSFSFQNGVVEVVQDE